MKPPPSHPVFDACAENYEAELDRGLSLSGEDKEYFARGRVAWMSGHLSRLAGAPRRVLDYGCGTGTAMPFLRELPGVQQIVGVDLSARSLDVARRIHGGAEVSFVPLRDFRPDASFDLAYCNGVFHHIPPVDRPASVACIYAALRPGGVFACWENNPWNPGTRWVMARIPFDRDAILVPPAAAGRLLAGAGFEVLSTTFRFVFPAALGFLRRFEDRLSSLCLGAQYQVLARKPGPADAAGSLLDPIPPSAGRNKA